MNATRISAILALAFSFALLAGCRYPYRAYRDPYTGQVYYVRAGYPTYTVPAPATSATVTYSNTTSNADLLYCTTCGRYYHSSWAPYGCPYCRGYLQSTAPAYSTYTTYRYDPYTYHRTYSRPRYPVYVRPRTHHHPKPQAHRPHERKPVKKGGTLRIKVPAPPKLPKLPKLPTNPVKKVLDQLKR
jgi:hypothetical protein